MVAGSLQLRGVGLICFALAVLPGVAAADVPARWLLELELGPAWQSRNDVQIPNNESGSRYSLEELVGSGPWFTGRLYATWNINRRHGLRLLLAPLSYTESGVFDDPVRFAGAEYRPGEPVEATYRFNSWRITWRYQLKDGERWRLWLGATAKVRDAEIALRQGDTSSRDTDVGFVPLFYLGTELRLAERWQLIFDLDALAGGPGRAVDLALKLGYDISPSWSVTAGYRTVEGGADTDDVYSFAWLHYAVASAIYRF